MMKKRRRRQRLPSPSTGRASGRPSSSDSPGGGTHPPSAGSPSWWFELYIGARPRWWPYHREGDLRAILGAAVLDLRHLRDVLEFAERCETYHREDALLAGFANRLRGGGRGHRRLDRGGDRGGDRGPRRSPRRKGSARSRSCPVACQSQRLKREDGPPFWAARRVSAPSCFEGVQVLGLSST